MSEQDKAAPVEQEQEPVSFRDCWPEFHAEGMGCGLEDQEITDRYEAMRYGWNEALDRAWETINLFGPLYTHPKEWVGLTDDEIKKEFDRECWVRVIFADGTNGIALDKTTAIDFARTIEAKLKGKNT